MGTRERYPIAMTAQSLENSAFGGAGISASGTVSAPHFTQTAFHRFQILRHEEHQRPSFVPANSRNAADPTRPASPPVVRSIVTGYVPEESPGTVPEICASFQTLSGAVAPPIRTKVRLPA